MYTDYENLKYFSPNGSLVPDCEIDPVYVRPLPPSLLAPSGCPCPPHGCTGTLLVWLTVLPPLPPPPQNNPHPHDSRTHARARVHA
jgi:hypothetical protein